MPGLLRSLWDEPRPPHPPRRTRWDAALVIVLVALAVLEGVLRPDLPWRWLSVVLVIGMTPTLPWRRTRPLPMLALAFGLSGLATAALGGEIVALYTMVAFLLLPYALFRWGAGREIVIGSAILLANAAVTAVFDDAGADDAVGGFAVLFSVCAVGAALRYRAGARARELDRVRLLERERIARDLHDTVAHHVSAMAIRAQAGLALAGSRPGAAVDALEVIESEASRALAEMRAMVRVLRRNAPADLAPHPRVDDLHRLAGTARTGPPVEVEIAENLDDLPPSVAAALYRLAQEAVTNARRHARDATRVHVRVTADDTSVRLRVSDDGDTGPRRTTAVPGYGITGMIERADLLGGTCEAAPDPDRGWTVTAVLPRSGVAT
ncbi:sensor histidine kinase [Nocardiopsis sp. N85]|uniref:sensor histidine kinase n=1 Tax=Nocardiopsis sp. N85 TaxID=3029400 RepID=UPI00237EFB2B|nr:sensor histidine kinase [Nocardiopsis sp. N85]MDE3721958.1 sensor histidine kinase [Nocardiopsis sp. N85]